MLSKRFCQVYETNSRRTSACKLDVHSVAVQGLCSVYRVLLGVAEHRTADKGAALGLPCYGHKTVGFVRLRPLPRLLLSLAEHRPARSGARARTQRSSVAFANLRRNSAFANRRFAAKASLLLTLTKAKLLLGPCSPLHSFACKSQPSFAR